MKSMLGGLVVTVLVVGLAWQLFAQVPQRQKDRQMMGVPQEFLAEHLEKLSEELNLTPEQKEKLSRLMKERKQERTERMAQARKELQKKHLERLSEELKLTSTQKQKISQFIDDGWKKIVKERKKMMKTVHAIRISVDKRIEKILTPEQREKFEMLKKQRMKDIKRQRRGVRGKNGMMELPPEPE